MNPINPKEKVEQIVKFLTQTFNDAGFKDAIVAVSGGIDSALSCALTVKALGKDRVYPLFLPYGELNQKGVEDAQLVTSFLQIPSNHIQTINIKSMVDQLSSYDPSADALRLGNMMARIRMIVVFDQAKKNNALVVGTENKTEHFLGYYTRFGDEASDIEPLRGLYKTQVYELAKFLNIPTQLLTKAPTAGLWEGQTDEGEFGFTYKQADEILSRTFDMGETIEQIEELGIKKEIIQKVLLLSKKNEFKHNLPHKFE